MPRSWDTSEGGGLIGSEGPVEVTIEKSYFGYDAQYQDGETLVWILEGTSPTQDEPVRQFYSMGDGWDTSDGTEVFGKDEFGSITNYAFFFGAALETKAADLITSRGFPHEAAIWVGLVFMMERRRFHFKFSGKEDSRLVFAPVDADAFVGEAGESKPKKDKSKSKSKKDKDKGESKGGGGKALRAKIKNLAKKHEDHDDFVAAVLDKFPEVEDDDDLYSEVLDEDDIFASAH